MGRVKKSKRSVDVDDLSSLIFKVQNNPKAHLEKGIQCRSISLAVRWKILSYQHFLLTYADLPLHFWVR